MFQRFIAASFIATAITLCVGWAHAAPVKTQPIQWKTPGRCVVVETLVTDKATGEQRIARKMRCEYSRSERGQK